MQPLHNEIMYLKHQVHLYDTRAFEWTWPSPQYTTKNKNLSICSPQYLSGLPPVYCSVCCSLFSSYLAVRSIVTSGTKCAIPLPHPQAKRSCPQCLLPLCSDIESGTISYPTSPGEMDILIFTMSTPERSVHKLVWTCRPKL